jgi:cyclopropane-fatty-acyl-phospholipid synthase
MFEGDECDLDAAQRRKLAWHMDASAVPRARAVLDVGCGWGSLLKPVSDLGTVEHIVGLTLSDAQAGYLRGAALPGVAVRVESWVTHEPVRPYDAIVSVGALEHFANPRQTPGEKVCVYRDFFQRCRSWLTPAGRMSLQTIAFGNMQREDASEFMNSEIFPDSDLPFLAELLAALDGVFEVVAFRNDRLHYARTYDAWASNLRRHRDQAVRLVGEEEVRRQERHFKLAGMGYRMGKQYLLRFALRPIRESWSLTGAA